LLRYLKVAVGLPGSDLFYAMPLSLKKDFALIADRILSG